MIAVKTGLTAEQFMIPTPCEMVAVKIQTVNIPLIIIILTTQLVLCDALFNIARTFPNSPPWIAGYINLPDIQLKTNTVSKHQYTKRTHPRHILDIHRMGLT